MHPSHARLVKFRDSRLSNDGGDKWCCYIATIQLFVFANSHKEVRKVHTFDLQLILHHEFTPFALVNNNPFFFPFGFCLVHLAIYLPTHPSLFPILHLFFGSSPCSTFHYWVFIVTRLITLLSIAEVLYCCIYVSPKFSIGVHLCMSSCYITLPSKLSIVVCLCTICLCCFVQLPLIRPFVLPKLFILVYFTEALCCCLFVCDLLMLFCSYYSLRLQFCQNSLLLIVCA